MAEKNKKYSTSFNSESYDKYGVVLHMKDDFVVISKPYDIRMNGDFPVTVETIVQKWYESQPDYYNNNKGKVVTENEKLTFRPLHQLDFATSGLLCLGLSKNAAAIGGLAFQKRFVKKSYLALVHGHIDINTIGQQYNITPTFQKCNNYEEAKKFINYDDNALLEEESLRKQHKIQKHDFVGINDVPKCWQDKAMIINLQEDLKTLNDFQATLTPTSSIFEEINEFTTKDIKMYCYSKGIRKKLRKVMKKYDLYKSIKYTPPSNKTMNIDIKKGDNDEEKQIEIEEKENTIQYYKSNDVCNFVDNDIKNFYTSNTTNDKNNDELKEKDPVMMVIETPDRQFIRIRFPIYTVEGTFHMSIGGKQKGGSYADTVVEVLEYGEINAQPVTKVLLRPLTGRRHQLRLHCRSLGHAIVGDMTYTYNQDLYERMMLHAYHLDIPIKYCLQQSKKKMKVNSSGDWPDNLVVTDRDPFIDIMDKKKKRKEELEKKNDFD